MNNYEKITAIINSGHLAICELEGCYIIYSTICSDGDIRNSTYSIDKKNCLDTLGEEYQSKENINSQTFTSIKPYAIKPKMLKVGDMVDILEVARECETYHLWYQTKKEMVGKGPFKIHSVYDDINGLGYTIYGANKKRYFFSHYAVCLHTEEIEETITIETKDGQSLEISKEKAIELGFIINE